jgi:hypothetical protein
MTLSFCPLPLRFALLATLALTGCPSDDPTADLLAAGFVYEGWLIVEGAPVPAGRFSVTEADSTTTFTVDAAAFAAATAYVLTIEPEPDNDPGPSPVHLLAGDLVGGESDLSIGHPAALGDDLTGAAGGYILMTPTSVEATDYNQGIWWLDPSGGAPAPVLELPELPAGWVYEGWVVVEGAPISTGTFAAGDAEDSDGPGLTAGPEGSPPLPGQDFIDPAVDLVGGVSVISVEPVPDTSPAPFALKPLVDGEIEDVGGGVVQDMANNAGGTSGTIR